MRQILIANPKSGNFIGEKKIETLKNFFDNRGWQTDFYLTKCPNDAIGFCVENQKKYDVFTAVGGDGTINEICQLANHCEFTLAVIPTGSANVLAKELKIPENNIFKSAEVLLNLKTIQFDVWRANERLFLLFISGGLDAFAVATVNPNLKKRIGKSAYIFEFFKYFFTQMQEEYEIKFDDKKIITKQFFITNIKKYAGNFVLNTMADYNDNTLELISFNDLSRANILKFALYLFFKKNIKSLNFIDFYQAQQFEIIQKNDNLKNKKFSKLPIQYDGDSGLNTNLTIKKNRYKIRVIHNL